MKSKIKAKDRISAILERPGSAVEKVLMSSRWEWEHWRKGELIDRWMEKNICTDEGLEHVLDVAFSGATQIASWYVAVYNTNTTAVAGMTYATPGLTEATNYAGERPAWQEGGVSSKSITNSANKASFTFASAATIYGGLTVGGGSAATTPGDAAGGGVLYNVSAFTGGAKSVASDDVLKVTVALTIADA